MAASKTNEQWVLMTELNGEPLLHHFKLSNWGNVVRIKKGEGPEEPFHPKQIGGYKYISFTTREGTRETIYLHRLVAEFFVKPAKKEYEFVIHKDYDRTNNSFDNLKWVSRETLYKHRAAKAGRHPGQTNKTKRQIKESGPGSEAFEMHNSRMKRLISEFIGINQ